MIKDIIDKIQTLQGTELDLVKEAVLKREEYLDATHIEPFKDYGELYEIPDFLDDVAFGNLVPSDGCGYYATSEGVSRLQYVWFDIRMSDIIEEYGFTHIVWYNK